MTTKPPDLAELNAMAIEACDMWQEHLSNLANDSNARAELTRFLEPQRRLFADWASMMQQGAASPKTPPQGDSHESRNAKTNETAAPDAAAQPASASAPPGGAAHGDDALRVAQLALRLAELEKRVAQLEGRVSQQTRRA